jgi:Peptidase family M28
VTLGRNTKRRIVFYGSLLLAIASFAFYCCAMPGRSFRGSPPPLDIREARYEALVRAHVVALAETIGERNTMRPRRLHQAADYIESSLRDAGYSAQRHSYTVDDVTCDTLDADLVGTTAPREIVVVGAHYDSANFAPGADDNGSGSAGVLALARSLAGRPMKRTVRFALFPNEEPPYFARESMGSLVYARELKARGDDVVAMLSLESIGYFTPAPGSQRYPGIVSAFYPDRGDFVAFVGDKVGVGAHVLGVDASGQRDPIDYRIGRSLLRGLLRRQSREPGISLNGDGVWDDARREVEEHELEGLLLGR